MRNQRLHNDDQIILKSEFIKTALVLNRICLEGGHIFFSVFFIVIIITAF